MIPYGKQDIDQSDIDAVLGVLTSDYLTQGPKVPEFESKIAEYVGANHAVAMNSATSALHVACLALGVGPGDLVWTSPNTFVASANCALFCGADVDFVDVERATGNIDVDALEAKLETALRNDALPKLLIPVHFAGQPCDMERIAVLGRKYGFRIIEDASHALGARVSGRPVGSCEFSDITVFSFHPVKILTTCEGGALLTNQDEVAEKARLLRVHGITRDQDGFQSLPKVPWSYEQQLLGFNYRMNDVEAALGLSQFARLSGFLERRQYLAARYRELLRDVNGVEPLSGSLEQSSWHLFVVHVSARDHVYELMQRSGIGVGLHYIPVYRQPYHMRNDLTVDQFPGMESYFQSALTLPLYPGLSEQQQNDVVYALEKIIMKADL